MIDAMIDDQSIDKTALASLLVKDSLPQTLTRVTANWENRRTFPYYPWMILAMIYPYLGEKTPILYR